MKMVKSFLNPRLTLVIARKAKAMAAVLSFLFLAGYCQAQGTMKIRFEGQMSPLGGYSESGMWFRNAQNGPEVLVLTSSGISGYPDDGTQYLQMTMGTGLTFSYSPFAAFNLISFDVAEYHTSLPGPKTLHVVGYIFGSQGMTVTADLITDGIIDGPGGLPDFQTFTFDNSFRNLSRVEILTDRWSLDNLVISGVPEPTTGALLFLGILCMYGRVAANRKSP